MALGKGIPVINGFDLNSKLPLDSRTVADTMEDMNKLVTDGLVGDGQLCYCKEDKKLYVLKDGVWSEVGGGGGKSVPPTLWLIDGHTQDVRTTITEEEYNNLNNGLYNQVVYNTNDDFVSMYSPSKLFGIGGKYGFVQFKMVGNEDGTFSYSSMVANLITIGEKNTSNEYPITIENLLTINPPSSSSYPYITGRINASDTQTSSFPKTDSETRVVTIENLDLSKLLNTRTIIVDADADASEVFNIACGAYGETEGIRTYVSSISCNKKTNNLFFFYITMDIQTSSLIIKRKTIPTSTTIITFED